MTEFAGKRAKAGKSKEILERLIERRLFKCMFKADLDAFSVEVKTKMGNYKEDPANLKLRMRIERGLADVLSSQIGTKIDSDFVIFKRVKIKSIHELALNDGQVLVEGDGTPQPIDEVSRFLGSVGKAGAGVDLEVYAPIEWPVRFQRGVFCEKFRQDIVDVIEAVVKEETDNHDSV